jgi:death on curing protein
VLSPHAGGSKGHPRWGAGSPWRRRWGARPRPAGIGRGRAASDCHGEPLFTDPLEIAAAYIFYLPRNHLFMDGNKRTALATCLVFLSENGLLPDEGLDADAWEFLTMDVAANRIDREQTTERLRALTPKSGKK